MLAVVGLRSIAGFLVLLSVVGAFCFSYLVYVRRRQISCLWLILGSIPYPVRVDSWVLPHR
jgi:hypothetical protein